MFVLILLGWFILGSGSYILGNYIEGGAFRIKDIPDALLAGALGGITALFFIFYFMSQLWENKVDKERVLIKANTKV